MKETTLISLIIIFGCFQGGHNDERSKLCFKEKKNQSKSGTCPEPGQPNDFTSCCKEPEYSDGFRFVCCPQNQKNSENTREVIIKEQQIFMKGTAASNARSLFGEIEINNVPFKKMPELSKSRQDRIWSSRKNHEHNNDALHTFSHSWWMWGLVGFPLIFLLFCCMRAFLRLMGCKSIEELEARRWSDSLNAPSLTPMLPTYNQANSRQPRHMHQFAAAQHSQKLSEPNEVPPPSYSSLFPNEDSDNQ